MYKIIYVTGIILISLFSLAVDCGYGPRNRTNDSIDTTDVEYLDSLLEVTISFNIRGWDKTERNRLLIEGAIITSYNTDTTVLTDSAGEATVTFFVDSVPFEYGFMVSKEGYGTKERQKWSEKAYIWEGIYIYENE